MSKISEIIIGSNNAYNWYAVLGADGELIDCAMESEVQIERGESLADYVARQIAEYKANGEHWEGAWDDGDNGRNISAMLEESGEDVDDAIKNGEELALRYYGGDIKSRVQA